MNLASNTALPGIDQAVQGRRHPFDDGMLDPPLHVRDGVAGVTLIPAPVEVLGDRPKLHDQIVGQILRLELAAFFAPEPEQGGFVAAHDYPGIGATDETTPIQIELWHKYTPLPIMPIYGAACAGRF